MFGKPAIVPVKTEEPTPTADDKDHKTEFVLKERVWEVELKKDTWQAIVGTNFVSTEREAWNKLVKSGVSMTPEEKKEKEDSLKKLEETKYVRVKKAADPKVGFSFFTTSHLLDVYYIIRVEVGACFDFSSALN